MFYGNSGKHYDWEDQQHTAIATRNVQRNRLHQKAQGQLYDTYTGAFINAMNTIPLHDNHSK